MCVIFAKEILVQGGESVVFGGNHQTMTSLAIPLPWRQNGRDCVWNHQPHDCLLNRFFRRRSKKTSKFCVTGLCAGWPVNSPHKGPVTRKMFPFWWRHHVQVKHMLNWFRYNKIFTILRFIWCHVCCMYYSLYFIYCSFITMTSTERHGHSNHRQHDCLCNSFYRLTHHGPVTQYCGASILCKNPIFFIMKEFPQIFDAVIFWK